MGVRCGSVTGRCIKALMLWAFLKTIFLSWLEDHLVRLAGLHAPLLCLSLFPQGWDFTDAMSHPAFKSQFWEFNSNPNVCAVSTLSTELSTQPGKLCFKDYFGLSYLEEMGSAKVKGCKVMIIPMPASVVDTSKNCSGEAFPETLPSKPLA